MESKISLKNILEACKRAEFSAAFDLLKNCHEKIDEKSATALIVRCCNTCVANMSTPECVSEHDLFVLLELIASFLTNPSEKELLSYLQSIFFILKLLVKKKCFGTVVKLERVVVPPFLPKILPKKHSETYHSSASLLHTFVAKASEEKNFTYNESLIRISCLASTIYSKVSNVANLFSVSYNCAVSLYSLQAPTGHLQEYFNYVLNLVKKGGEKVRSEDAFKPFLCHFGLTINGVLKKFDFEMAADIYRAGFKNAVEIFEGEDFIDILTLIGLPLLFLPLNLRSLRLDSVEVYNKALKKLDGTSIGQVVENKLYMLLNTIVFSYYKSVDGKQWCELQEELQLALFSLIYRVGEFETRFKHKCPCNCLLENNLYQGFSYSQYICILIELSVSNGSNTADFHEKCVELLAKFAEEIVIMKESDCSKWRNAWSSLSNAVYNIGVHLYQKSNEACLNYFYLLIKLFIEFEVRTDTFVVKPSIISSSFTAVCALTAKEHRKGMAFTALATLLCPNHRENWINNWIKAKVSQRDIKTPEGEEVQRITLVSAFARFKSELSNVTGDFRFLTVKDKVELLVSELEQYKKRWRSKVPMMAALRELCETANLHTCVKVIVDIFGDCELNLHDEVPKILHRVLKCYEKKVSGKGTPRSSTYLAILYFLHYKYCVSDTITKNADEMERSICVATQSSEPPDAIPRDPTEECDIVSSYESLRLDKYSCVMKYLLKSLTLFSSVISEDFDPNSVEISTTTLYNLLLKISFEYRLHCHRLRSLQALQLALKLAKMDNHPCRIVESSGFLIEYSDVTKNFVRNLIVTADRQIASIDCTVLTNVKTILTYYVCKAKAYLYQDYKEAYRIFQMAEELYESRRDKDELELIRCQLLMLRYKFVMMPCSLKMVDHKESTLFTVHSANTGVFEAYNKSNIGGSYEMSVLLECNNELAKLYHDLRCPREVRAFCRETVILAQKLVLPFPCASYLLYLAHADLKSARLEDCQMKLNGLADILCLTKHNVQIEEIESPPIGNYEKEVDIITNDMQEMVLDLPVPNHYKRQLSPASPAFIIQPFRLPGFVNHEKDCDCFPCFCFEYQQLVLEKVRLDALLNVKQGNHKVANDFFVGGLGLHECYLRRYKGYKEIASRLVPSDLIPEFSREFLAAFGGTLLNYSYHLMRGKDRVEASKVTEKLIGLLRRQKVELAHLYNEALAQKLTYLTDIPEIKVEHHEELEVDACELKDIPKTPECKHSKVTLSSNYSPVFSPLKRVPKKCLKFNISPEQQPNDDKPKTVKAVPKTPAPKIQIFSNDDATLKAKTPLPKIHIFTDTKRSTRKKAAANTEPSNGVSTPMVAPPKDDGALKSRTKLLTERLRQSSKKPEGQNGVQKASVRKNLLSELGVTEGEQSVGQGAVKRTTRQRKI